jgi:thiamine pyrophosphate-dependent acetolactate synthase large subunit-like protein
VPTAPPQGDGNAVREAARLLVNAERPVIVADKCARTADGVKLLVELAEALQAPVVDQKGRMNFPNRITSTRPRAAAPSSVRPT